MLKKQNAELEVLIKKYKSQFSLASETEVGEGQNKKKNVKNHNQVSSSSDLERDMISIPLKNSSKLIMPSSSSK